MMWLSCLELTDAKWWMKHGGDQTLLSYGAPRGEADLSVVPVSHLDWIAALPLMHVDQHRIFVHAGVDPDLPLERQDREHLVWKRYRDSDERGHGERHVVHGHHPFQDGPLRKRGRTDLDTLAWRTGRLVVGVFDDAIPGGPIDLIEIKREGAPGLEALTPSS